ncbi:MAG TPA: DMT family transporter [Burkholderiales bacterium]|nr:DMT family transporter [Burkholderiales bacterium]
MAAAYALVAAALFGAALVTTQFGLRHMDGLAGAKVSITFATALFWLLFPLRGFDGWNTQAAGVFLALGLFFPVAVTLLAYEANRRMGPTIAGAIGSTAPLFAVLGAVLFLGETLGLTQIAATVAIVCGSVVLVWRSGRGRSNFRRGAAWASSVAWFAAALRALAQVVAKAGLLLWPNPYAAAVLGYSVSALTIWIIAAFSRRPESRVYTRRGVFWFALTGLFNCSAVLALYTALDGGAVNIVSPIAATYPMFTLVLNSVILREERLSARLIIGAALMVSGVAALLIY